jgi:hypothetical protein
VLNTESPDPDLPGHEGVVNRFHIQRMEATWREYQVDGSRTAMLFRSPYLEDVRGQQGTGPNLEIGGGGSGDSDRGVRYYFDWLQKNVGRWEFPRHVR